MRTPKFDSFDKLVEKEQMLLLNSVKALESKNGNKTKNKPLLFQNSEKVIDNKTEDETKNNLVEK